MRHSKIKKITLNNQTITYTQRISTQARNLRLSISPDGRIMATKPWGISETDLEKFITQKANWILKYINEFKSKPKINLFTKDREDYCKNKELARQCITDKIKYFNTNYCFQYKRVSIKNQTSIWGSCSHQNNLNFNYRIIFLPKEIADYIVVHELCHLKEHNHSKNFWNLVARTIPDHKELRKQLRKYSLE